MARNLHLNICDNGALVVFYMFWNKFLPVEPTEIYDVGNNGKLILVLKLFFLPCELFYGKIMLAKQMIK